jgi:AcrR family transcriptional regulator
MPEQTSDPAERILDKALELAEAESWEQLRLHSVADELGIPLDDIRQHFPQKDDLVEAWFDRADRALLAGPFDDKFFELPPPQRLQQVIMRWLDALAPHRRLTREMLMYKLEPGHFHLQALGIMRISRTVQWFREAACQDSTDLQRIAEESTLTLIYLLTFARWLKDDSADSRNTRRRLENTLAQWDAFGNRLKRLLCTPADKDETA